MSAHPKHLTEWVKKQVSAFLGYPDDGQLANHLLSFTSKSQLTDYTREMLGDNRAVVQFTSEMWRRKTGEKDATTVALRAATAVGSGQQPAKRDIESESKSGASAPSSKSKDASSDVDWQKGRNLKVRYVSAKGSGASEVSRTMCHCQATTHPLFTNCTACGKIVCESEGEGPCFFCGSLVTQAGTFINEQFAEYMKSMEKEEKVTNKPQKDGSKGAGSSESATSSSSSSSAADDSASLARAEAQRDKLLSFASGSKSSKIYDQQSDWFEFESNSWLSKEARAQKQAETEQALLDLEKRRAHTLTIDLAGKQIVAHSSDAWLESTETQQQRGQAKWTDEEPAAAQQQHASADSSSSEPHIPGFVSAIESHYAGDGPEFKAPSRHHFHNDTLSGRAKQVYDDLRQSLRAAASTSVSATAASTATPADKPSHNALLSSLAKSSGSRVSGFDDPNPDLGGLTASMGGLSLARNTQQAADVTHDEDEPTNCAGAMDADGPACPDSEDRGMCLSLWQPWASLVVLGIKRFEGRGWYTPHRGRLWIASGSRETTPEEIEQVEAEYREVYGPNAKIPFPKEYPTSALLGCVDLTACWSADEFQALRAKKNGPAEDSQSAFVFACTHPRVLPLLQSHSGQHKLYSLPPKLYQAIGPNLKPTNEKWRLTLPAFNCKAQLGFDIWPPNARPSPPSSLLPAVKPTVSVVQPGMLLLKNGLSVAAQQQIVDCVRHIGLLGGDVGFTTPTFANGVQMNLQMMCFGMRWNHTTNTWERLNAQGRPMKAIPTELLSHAERMIGIATEYLRSHGAGGVLPSYTPDVCIVNYYSAESGRLGMHQDKDESPQSIQAGYPVVSFSIGDTASFAYGPNRIPDARLSSGSEDYSKLDLASGDVLLFGGPSRLIFHGVERIRPNTKPRGIVMRQGRINLTFRKL